MQSVENSKSDSILVLGAKGFAKEVLEVIYQNNPSYNITFFDNISNDLPEKLFNKFGILTDFKQVGNYFNTVDTKFTIGIGNPFLRKSLLDTFLALGGKYVSTISKHAKIGSFDVNIGKGSNVLDNAIVSNSVSIGMGCIIYYNCMIAHDCEVGNFVELSPGATLLGNCKVGSFCHIGANATILPKIKIGTNVIIGAGAVVTKDVPNDTIVAGVPAKIIKKLQPIKN